MPIFGKNKNNDKNNDKNTEKNVPEVPAAAAEPVKEEAPAAPASAPAAEPAAEPAPQVVPDVTMTSASKYHTPEGFEFNRYFLAERRVFLENVSYETQRPQAQGQLKLGVKDTILAQLVGQAGVKVTFNRTLRFDPEGPFTLSVSFAVMLVFNPGTRGEIDWHTIDVAEEFKKNCPQLVQAMMAKSALLVAEITAANGGAPIIPLK